MKFAKLLKGVAQFAAKSAATAQREQRRSASSGAASPRTSTRSETLPKQAPRAGSGSLQISYEPAMDGDADPGEIVWAWIPYEDDPSQGKDRPCLVIGRMDGRLATVALTSKASGPERDRVSVGTGEWDRERRPSYAKIDRVILLVPSAVRREGAIFPKDRFDSVVAATAARKPDFQRA